MGLFKRTAACLVGMASLPPPRGGNHPALHLCRLHLGSEEAKRKQATSFDSVITEKGYDWPFANMQELFQNDDLTVVNLEGVLSDSNRSENKDKTYRFRGPTAFVDILTRSGIEAVNLANNHTQDLASIKHRHPGNPWRRRGWATSAGAYTSLKKTGSRWPSSG